MNIVILAGGYGTRLHEKTEKIPKPMVNIGRKPMLFHIIDYYMKFDQKRFIICSGYKSNYIKKYMQNKFKGINTSSFLYKDAEIKLFNTGLNTNTGGRIHAVKEHLDNEFHITYGDGLSDVDVNSVMKLHNKSKTALTISVGHPTSRFGEVNIQKNIVKSFNEKPKLSGWINIGYMFGNRKLFNYLKNDDIFEIDTMNKLIKESELSAYKHTGNFFPVDNIRDLREANKIYKDRKAFWL